MRAQTLPPAAGWQWLLAGFGLFRRSPAILGLMLIAYWFTVLFLNVLPVIGTLAASLAIPGLSVGLMQAARCVDRGVQINLGMLYGSFRDNPRTLLALGALYLCCTLGILGITTLFDGGDLFRYMLADTRVERAALEEADFTIPMLVIALLMTPLMMAYWFAPALAAWHRLSVGKSLFFSFVACWINWRAFMIYGLGMLVITMVVPAVLLGIALLLVPAAAQLMTALVLTPMLLIVAPSIYASFYASYRDIFGISEIV